MERAVEVLTLDRDAFHTMQSVHAQGSVVSPLLGGAAFALELVFANVGAGEGGD